jgi:predicted nucleic acid-binding protein
MATRREAGGEAYVDTSAFVAFLDRSDTHHPLFRRLFSQPPPLITTPLVVGEGQAWFLRRYDRTRALQFVALIELLKPLQIAAVGPAELAGATQVLRRFADQDLTLTDALGLHLVRARGIGLCWSSDRHLGLTGAALVVDRH